MHRKKNAAQKGLQCKRNSNATKTAVQKHATQKNCSVKKQITIQNSCNAKNAMRKKTATQKSAMQNKLQRDRNCKAAAQRFSNINHHPTPTCIKPSQPFPQKAQETRTMQQKLQYKKTATQKELQCKKNCSAKKTAAQKNCSAKKTAAQKKLQRKKNCNAKKNCKRVPTVVRAFDPSPYPKPPQTIPIHILDFN